jgi:hypothetical protein
MRKDGDKNAFSKIRELKQFNDKDNKMKDNIISKIKHNNQY